MRCLLETGPDLQLRDVKQERSLGKDRLKTIARNLECDPCVMTLKVIKYSFCYTTRIIILAHESAVISGLISLVEEEDVKAPVRSHDWTGSCGTMV